MLYSYALIIWLDRALKSQVWRETYHLCLCLDCLSKGVSGNTSREEMCMFFFSLLLNFTIFNTNFHFIQREKDKELQHQGAKHCMCLSGSVSTGLEVFQFSKFR